MEKFFSSSLSVSIFKKTKTKTGTLTPSSQKQWVSTTQKKEWSASTHSDYLVTIAPQPGN